MRYLACLLLLVSFAASAQTGQAVLSCTPPTKNTDGSNISGAITYKFYKTAPSPTVTSPVQTSCAYTWTGLAVGTHTFAVTATVGGIESAMSTPASKTVVPPTPNPPTNLTVAADQTAYIINQSRDRVAMVPVGTIPQGTQCDSTQSVMGKFVIPRSAVVWAGTVRSEVVFATCG